MRILSYFFLILFSVGLETPFFAQNTATSSIPLEELFGDLSARHIGPALMSGRVSDLVGHPTIGSVILVGAAGGGVWKSVDAGLNYTPIFDDHIQSIGSVAIDPNDPDQTYWVGTGEPWVRNSVSVGDGVYVSKDAGKSWKHKGLSNSERISSIVIHPEDGNTIYVGVLGSLWGESADRGVYKTIDGGENWTLILRKGNNTGCADLTIDLDNPMVLYASMWEFDRTAYSFNSGGENSALYKSTDAGKTWDKLSNGLPDGRLGRIGVAIAPSEPNILYAVVECEKDTEKGLYKSTDAGTSWVQTNNDFGLTVRPFYFSRIVVHPTNPDFIAKAGLNGSISEDGGKTFRLIGDGVHADVHDFWFDIDNPDKITLGCDGGVYTSWNKGVNWKMVEGLPLSQYYHLTLDNETPYNIYGGLQDNGSWIGPSRSIGGITARDWKRVGYGDGFRVFPHPEKSHLIYSEMQGADNIWLVDTKNNSVKIVKPYQEIGEKFRFNWNAPITTSMHNPDRFFVGSQFVHKSDDMGNSWKIISPDLTTNDKSKQNQKESGGLSMDNSGAENHCTIFTIAESPLDEKIIWAGTDDGNVQITVDGGKNWKNVTNNLDRVPKNTWTYHIEPSSHDAKTAYAVFDGHTQNDQNPYVQKTMDGGKTWKSIATSEIKGFVRCIQEDFENTDLLFLGTEYGLYITIDGGEHWAHFEKNMPPVAIHHLELQPQTNDLVMATHGRGIIILDDISILRQIDTSLISSNFQFLDSRPNIQYNERGFGGYANAGMFVGANASRSAAIPYYMNKRHVFGKMEMSVYDESGRKLTDLIPGKSKGINIARWNYNLPQPKIAKGKTLTFDGFAAPTVPPGTYEVRVTKGKETFTKSIEILPDPNSVFSAEEMKIQYEKVMELYHMNEQLAFVVHQNDNISAELEKLIGDAGDKKYNKEAVMLKKRFFEQKKLMVITSGDNYVGAAEPELREKIASLYSDVMSYAGQPTESQLDRLEVIKEILNTKVEEHNSTLKQVINLNKYLKEAGKEVIKIPEASDFLDLKS